MSQCYIYLGDEFFEMLNFVKFREEEENTSLPNTSGTIFDSLVVEGQKLPVQDVCFTWSIAVFRVDGKFYRCGFDVEVECCSEQPVLLDVNLSSELANDVKFSGALNRILLTSQKCAFLVLSTEKHLHEIDISSMDGLLKQAATSDCEIFFVTEDGLLYSMSNFSLPEPIPAHKVIEVACGKEHTLLLTSSGCVYSFGCGSRGQLGLGSIEDCPEPMVIELLDGVFFKSIAAGDWHSAAISECGDLYTWGWNESGQLGKPCKWLSNDSETADKVVETCFSPEIVEMEKDVTVTAVSLGSRHSCVILSDSTVWTWGFNGNGQLGYEADPCSDVPCQFPTPSGFTPLKIVCSTWSTLITGTCDENINHE